MLFFCDERGISEVKRPFQTFFALFFCDGKAEMFCRNFGTWTIGSHEVRDASFMHQAGLTEDPHRQIHEETRNVKAENISEEVLIGVAISLGVHGKIKKNSF